MAAAHAQQVAAVQEQKTTAAEEKVIDAAKKEQGFAAAQQEDWLMAAAVQGLRTAAPQIIGDSCSSAEAGNANCCRTGTTATAVSTFLRALLCSGGYPLFRWDLQKRELLEVE